MLCLWGSGFLQHGPDLGLLVHFPVSEIVNATSHRHPVQLWQQFGEYTRIRANTFPHTGCVPSEIILLVNYELQ